MSGPYQGLDLSNCGVGRLRVAINRGVLSVKVGSQLSEHVGTEGYSDNKNSRITETLKNNISWCSINHF